MGALGAPLALGKVGKLSFSASRLCSPAPTLGASMPCLSPAPAPPAPLQGLSAFGSILRGGTVLSSSGRTPSQWDAGLGLLGLLVQAWVVDFFHLVLSGNCGQVPFLRPTLPSSPAMPPTPGSPRPPGFGPGLQAAATVGPPVVTVSLCLSAQVRVHTCLPGPVQWLLPLSPCPSPLWVRTGPSLPSGSILKQL